MICGAAMIFDAAPEAALRNAWSTAARAGISDVMAGVDYPPHLTLFTAESLDMRGARAALAQVAAATPPAPLRFHGFGIFPGAEAVVYLAPTPTAALLDLHAHLYQVLAPHARGIPAYYAPGVWLPHVTLGIRLGPDKLGAMLGLATALILPETALLTGVIFGTFDDPVPDLPAEAMVGSRLERVMFAGGQSAVKVRHVQPGDAEAYNRLVERLDYETQFMMAEPGERRLTVLDQRKRIQAVLATDNQMIFVAENAAGELVGLLGAHGGMYQRDHDSVHIYIGILQAYSGQGLGARMFAAMEDWARGWYAHRLDLSVMEHNQRAIGLYRKMGFRFEGHLRGAILLNGMYIDELIMSKLLD